MFLDKMVSRTTWYIHMIQMVLSKWMEINADGIGRDASTLLIKSVPLNIFVNIQVKFSFSYRK